MISEAEKKNLKVGYKQTMKMLSKKCLKVYLSDDCEDRIKDSVSKAAKEVGCEIIKIDTMHELGRICSISRPASCAVVAID